MADANKNQWVERVLGYQFANGAGGGGAGALKAAAEAWRAASEAVDDQISALQSVLRSSGDDELKEIGEYGLGAVAGGFKVPLMAALRGAEAGEPRDREKLAAIIPQFRTHLERDERVEACDENPFGVALCIRATLVPALDQLERSLAA